MIRSDIRDRIRKKLGETTSAFWSDSEINNYINDGCRDISFRTKCLRTNGYLTAANCVQNTASAAASEVALTSISTAIYSVNEVYFLVDKKHWTKMESMAREEMDVDYPGWRDAIGRTYTDTSSGVTYYNYESMPGTPTHYYWDRAENIFGWYVPASADQSTSNNIRIYYSYKHTDLTSDTQEPTIPEPLTNAIIDYAIATGLEDRGWGDKANDRWNKYFAKLNDYNVEKSREREDEEIVTRNYRNI